MADENGEVLQMPGAEEQSFVDIDVRYDIEFCIALNDDRLHRLIHTVMARIPKELVSDNDSLKKLLKNMFLGFISEHKWVMAYWPNDESKVDYINVSQMSNILLNDIAIIRISKTES